MLDPPRGGVRDAVAACHRAGQRVVMITGDGVTFDNIRKVTFFLLSTSVATLVVIPGAMVLGWPPIMVPAQLLWLNLVTDGLQDLEVAFESGRARRPRPPAAIASRSAPGCCGGALRWSAS